MLWCALVIHSNHVSKPAKSSFSQYVVHGSLSSSGSDLHVCYPVFLRDVQYASLPSVMSSIQCGKAYARQVYYFCPRRKFGLLVARFVKSYA